MVLVVLPEDGRVSVRERRPAPRNARRARKSITGRRTRHARSEAEEIDVQSRYRKKRGTTPFSKLLSFFYLYLIILFI
jgi:hypothetical protein